MKATKSLPRWPYVITASLIAAIAVYLVYHAHQRGALERKLKEKLEAEMHAVNELRELGASVLHGTPRYPHMKSVTFGTVHVLDGKAISKVPTIVDAVINVPTIADEDLKHLEVLTNLGELNLTANGFTNDGLEHLQGLTTLKRLTISNPDITDEGLDCLKGLINLEMLDLTGTNVTNEGVEELQKSLPDCRIMFADVEGKPDGEPNNDTNEKQNASRQ